MQGCNVWNIDTGAGFYGKLTCLDVGTKIFWQSDVVRTFYPNEKGRNK
jgi:serine/threonine protein phosphatase 1